MLPTKPKNLEVELKKKNDAFSPKIISQSVVELVEANFVRQNKSTTALQLGKNGFWLLVTGCLVHQFPAPNWFLASRIGAFDLLPIIGESISHGKEANGTYLAKNVNATQQGISLFSPWNISFTIKNGENENHIKVKGLLIEEGIAYKFDGELQTV